jgi:hypothetical protein
MSCSAGAGAGGRWVDDCGSLACACRYAVHAASGSTGRTGRAQGCRFSLLPAALHAVTREVAVSPVCVWWRGGVGHCAIATGGR